MFVSHKKKKIHVWVSSCVMEENIQEAVTPPRSFVLPKSFWKGGMLYMSSTASIFN